MEIRHTQKKFVKILKCKYNDLKYNDLHVQSDTLLTEVFENFRNICIKIFELD